MTYSINSLSGSIIMSTRQYEDASNLHKRLISWFILKIYIYITFEIISALTDSPILGTGWPPVIVDIPYSTIYEICDRRWIQWLIWRCTQTGSNCRMFRICSRDRRRCWEVCKRSWAGSPVSLDLLEKVLFSGIHIVLVLLLL